MKKIILSAGGTGGHVFPACALSLELRKNGYYTILITDQRGVKYIHNEFDQVIILPVSSLNWKFFIFSPWLFIKSLISSFGVDQTISFGGYVSLFPVLSSVLSFKKFFIVQLDSIVTRFNRLFISYASQVFYLFPQTNFKKFQNNFYLTGLPVRSAFKFSFIKHSRSNFVISVIGGSLGSDYWKELLLNFAQGLSVEVRRSISLFIQTSDSVSFLTDLHFKEVIAAPFFDTADLFSKSHLIISRCGAGALAEIVTVGRPVFLVPWLGAIEDHQLHNANNLLFFGGCASGDYLSLLHFFSHLYESESSFIKACSEIVSSFEIDGKKNILKKLLNS